MPTASKSIAARSKKGTVRKSSKRAKVAGSGRKSQYIPELHDAAAYHLKLLGYSNRRIASEFGVAEATVRSFIKEHPSFAESIRLGTSMADAKVAHLLFEQCERGNVKAMITWLERRQPKLWGRPSAGNASAVVVNQPSAEVADKGYGDTATYGLPSERDAYVIAGKGPPVVKH